MNAIHPQTEAGLPLRTTSHIVPTALHRICIAAHIMPAHSGTLHAKGQRPTDKARPQHEKSRSENETAYPNPTRPDHPPQEGDSGSNGR